jgi:hypothetical protein
MYDDNKKIGKSPLGILIVAAALRATATAEFSSRCPAIYWRRDPSKSRRL